METLHWHLPKMLFCKRFGTRVIVGDDDEGAVTKRSCSERFMDCNDTSVQYALPCLCGADGGLIRQSKIFESAERVSVSILAGNRFVYPARVTEECLVLLRRGV